MQFLSLIIAFAPAVLFVASVGWARRRLERSTSALLGVAVVWGAFVATSFTLLAGDYVEARLPLHFGPETTGFGSVLFTPLLEEALKTLFLVMMLFQARLETALEGVLLGVAVGLGFAATENFLAFASALRAPDGSEWLASIAYRTGVTGMMHATAAAVAGAVLGHMALRAEFERWILGPLLGFVGAALVHMGFNGGVEAVIGFAPTYGRILAAGVGALVLLLGFGVGRAAIADERRVLTDALDREADAGRIRSSLAVPPGSPALPPRVEDARLRLALLLLRDRAHPARDGSARATEIAELRASLAD